MIGIDVAVVRQVVRIIAVVFIPETRAADGIDRIDDGDEVLEKFGGDVFVDWITRRSSMVMESMALQKAVISCSAAHA